MKVNQFLPSIFLFNLHGKCTSLVIPAVLQRDILSRLHEAHQGIVKCRERARNTVWWLGINKQLDEVVRNCNIDFKWLITAFELVLCNLTISM
jgi:hypothetical protein